MRTVTTWKDLLQPGLAPAFFVRQPLPHVDPNARSYDSQNAWWLAELCRLVYRHDTEEDAHPPQPTRSGFLAQVGLRQAAFFNDATTSTRALLVRSDRPPAFAVLVFRGTEQDPRDFVTDIALPLVPFGIGPGKVHSGFLEALKSVWGPISEALSHLDVPVFYTGHSLGAALAILAAACRPPMALYTFGSPLVGDAAFARTLSTVPVFRLVNGTDAVTVVPASDLGFCHVGEVHRLSGHSQPGILRHPLDWLRSVFGPPPSLADHAPINYVERLAPIELSAP